jgi:DNA modification methylase
MQAYGFTAPLLIDEKSGILAGHGRLLAAHQLQLTEVPVLVLDHLTEIQKRAYIIADNKLALNASWDEEKLRAELAALERELFDLELTGFDHDELERLTADLGEKFGNTDEDAAPEMFPVAVSVRDDLWTLGNHHRLLCGDATSIHDIERVMAGEQASMTFTDPPYNVNYKQRTTKSHLRTITNDNLGDGFEQFLYDACVNILLATKGAVYICMSSAELHTLYQAFTRAGGHWSTFLIWSKDRFTLGRSDYQRQYEPILYGWKREAQHFWCGARDQGDVWQVGKPRVNDLHPTMKPIELIERAIGNSSREGDVILDVFGGSGSTLIACQRTGRQARLIELDPRYVDVIVRRWEQFTGKAAVLESQGATFAEVADERLRKAA